MTRIENRAVRIAVRLLAMWLAAPIVWFAAAMIVGGVFWHLFHGKAVFGPYGADKSLSNLAVELPAVLILVTAIFPLTGPGRDAKWWRIGASLITVVAALVALLVPGLPE